MSSSIQERQTEIVDDFAFFEDWSDKYRHIIEIGDELEPLTEDQRSDNHLVPGCQSRVWLIAESQDNRIIFKGDSDAAIVKGLVALLINVYSGQTAEEILKADFSFIHEIGLGKHLSMNRANGLNSMIKALQSRAKNIST